MQKQHNRDVSDRANKDIKRLEEQDGKILGAEPTHYSTENDEIERWGRIIGRTLGFIAVIFLAYHLAVTYILN